jgi:hypothetical protein
MPHVLYTCKNHMYYGKIPCPKCFSDDLKNSKDLRAAKGILLAVALGCIIWIAGIIFYFQVVK